MTGQSGGLVEVLTHGVSGTEISTVLDTTRVKAVPNPNASPHSKGEFAACADQPQHVATHGHERIAYRWGGMTSGLKVQAIWALFAPFALVNVASWMVPDPKSRRFTVLVEILRALFRLIGLALTAVLIAQITYIVADALASQCQQLTVGDHSSRCWTWLGNDWWGAHNSALRAWAVLAVLLVIFGVGAFVSLWRDNDHDLRAEVTGSKADSKRTYVERFRDRVAENRPPSAIDDGGWQPPAIAADDFVRPFDGRATFLLTTHAIVGILTAAFMVGGGRLDNGLQWTVLVLIGIAALVTAACNDPRASGGRDRFGGPNSTLPLLRRMWWAFTSWRSAGWVAASFLILWWICAWTLPGRLDSALNSQRADSDSAIHSIGGSNVIGAALVVAAVLLAAAIVVTAAIVLFRGQQQSPVAPWLRGWHAPLVAALGVLLGSGAGVALSQLIIGAVVTDSRPAAAPTNIVAKMWTSVVQLLSAGALDDTNMVTPRPYAAITWMWGMAAMVSAGLIVVIVSVAMLIPRLTGRDAFVLWAPRVTMARVLRVRRTRGPVFRWTLAAGKSMIPGLVGIYATAAMVSAVVAQFSPGWVAETVWIQTLGILVLVVLALFLLRSVYNAAKSPKKNGRSLGVIWDLASFWPREAHPLVPPAYAPRAIRDLEAYVKNRLNDGDRVILGGHSQGSLLMYAVACRLVWMAKAEQMAREEHQETTAPGDDVDQRVEPPRIGLLTYGSQLGWAYGRAFPTALGHTSHVALRSMLKGRWINMVRFTDYIGDGVFCHVGRRGLTTYVGGDIVRSPQSGADTVADGPCFELTTAVDDGQTVSEVWLPDPSPGDDPESVTRQHSAYTSDRTWDVWIDKLWPPPSAMTADADNVGDESLGQRTELTAVMTMPAPEGESSDAAGRSRTAPVDP